MFVRNGGCTGPDGKRFVRGGVCNCFDCQEGMSRVVEVQLIDCCLGLFREESRGEANSS